MRLAKEQLKQIIKEELEIILAEEELEEVYSKRQRRWACSNPHELTAAQAREMCRSKKLKKKKSKK